MGRRLSRLLSAFETRILAVDMFPVDKPDWVESLWPAQRLDELLPLVDFLVLCVPLNPTTQRVIDAAALKKMKAGAVLVNVAAVRWSSKTIWWRRWKAGTWPAR